MKAERYGWHLADDICNFGFLGGNDHISLYISLEIGIIGEDNGLAPNKRHVIIWTNDRFFH